jgi:hypothetical protein
MTITSTQYKTATRTHRTVPVRRLLVAGLTAAIAGTAAVEAYAAIVRAAGVPIRAGFLGAVHAQPITASSFATGVLVCTFWGAVLAAIVCKLSARPRRTFLIAAITLATLSLIVPFGAGMTAASSKVTLAAAHILVASVVIPILARATPCNRGRCR